jgi:hypothetical protein
MYFYLLLFAVLVCELMQRMYNIVRSDLFSISLVAPSKSWEKNNAVFNVACICQDEQTVIKEVESLCVLGT